MYQIDVMSRVPVYEQIIQQTERFILLGILREGDQMESVRHLSVKLSVNPNTIQKAISELDRRGLICTVPGKGSFISEMAMKALSISKRQELVGIKRQLVEMKMAGVSKLEIEKMIDEIYAEGKKGEQL